MGTPVVESVRLLESSKIIWLLSSGLPAIWRISVHFRMTSQQIWMVVGEWSLAIRSVHCSMA